MGHDPRMGEPQGGKLLPRALIACGDARVRANMCDALARDSSRNDVFAAGNEAIQRHLLRLIKFAAKPSA